MPDYIMETSSYVVAILYYYYYYYYYYYDYYYYYLLLLLLIIFSYYSNDILHYSNDSSLSLCYFGAWGSWGLEKGVEGCSVRGFWAEGCRLGLLEGFQCFRFAGSGFRISCLGSRRVDDERLYYLLLLLPSSL